MQDAIVDRLVDPRFGLIGALSENPVEPGMPQLFHFIARGSDTERLGGASAFQLGGGASMDRERAKWKAIGEVVERYCSAFFSYERLPLVAANEAPFPCVEPSRFALYRDDQYAAHRNEFVPFTADLPVRWTQAIDVESGGERYVPAAAVYMPYSYLFPEEQPIMQPISTGLACGRSYEHALVSAACEAIERDAFTIFWQGKLAAPRIPLESLDVGNRELLVRFAKARFDVALFNVTTDIGIPSVMAAALHDDPTQPALTVAAAAHPVADVAVRKCLEELEHTRYWSKRLKATTPSIDPERTDLIKEQEEHLRFWSEKSNLHRADWLFGCRVESALPHVSQDEDEHAGELLSRVCGGLKSAGLQLLCVDLTTRDVDELGLHVVRAVVPGLHPLVIGHERRALGGHRLYDVPALLGHGVPNLPLDDPNPHPFP